MDCVYSHNWLQSVECGIFLKSEKIIVFSVVKRHYRNFLEELRRNTTIAQSKRQRCRPETSRLRQTWSTRPTSSLCWAHYTVRTIIQRHGLHSFIIMNNFLYLVHWRLSRPIVFVGEQYFKMGGLFLVRWYQNFLAGEMFEWNASSITAGQLPGASTYEGR